MKKNEGRIPRGKDVVATARGNITNESRNNLHSERERERESAIILFLVLFLSAFLSLSARFLQELLMYSDVRLVAPLLMDFPIFSFLHRARRFSLPGFTRFPCVSLSPERLSARLIDSRTPSRAFSACLPSRLFDISPSR